MNSKRLNSPGLSIDVTITMTGSATLGDIPSLNSTTVTAPIDFSPLTALSFIQHGSLPQIGFTGTLADFAPECLSGPCLTGFPTWVMAPYIIDLEADALDNASYDIRIAPGTLAATISYDTDAFDGCCGGDYLTTGIFVAEVSEPDPFLITLARRCTGDRSASFASFRQSRLARRSASQSLIFLREFAGVLSRQPPSRGE